MGHEAIKRPVAPMMARAGMVAWVSGMRAHGGGLCPRELSPQQGASMNSQERMDNLHFEWLEHRGRMRRLGAFGLEWKRWLLVRSWALGGR